MIGNYIKVASRNIVKRKLYSFINAFGLSIGIAFCILVYLFIQDEKSYDQFHANKNNIYRIEARSYNYWNQELDEKDRYNHSAYLQSALKQALKDELPEVEYATRLTDGRGIVKNGTHVFTEQLTYVDADFFKIFSFPLLAGNEDKLFVSKQEVVITPDIAKKYFGNDNPIGKTLFIHIEGEKAFTVTGILDAPPVNSSVTYSILLPQENRRFYEFQMARWGNSNTPTIVQVTSETDLTTFRRNLAKVIDKYAGPQLEKWRKEGNVAAEIKMLELDFTRLTDWHLKKEIDWHKVSDPQYAYILGGIAILILLIACINYISLALTTSAMRKTEVGIRKVAGAFKSQLICQFAFESVMLAFISMVAGVLIVILALPYFNVFTERNIHFFTNEVVSVLGISLALCVVVGIAAGSYPAFFLSAFRPAMVLKGGQTTRVRAGFTKPLVVLQFALSAFLIVSSVIMYRQMNFITTKNLGYDQHQVLIVPTQTEWSSMDGNKVVNQFRARLIAQPDIVSVGGTNLSFNRGWSYNGYTINGESKSAYVYSVDPYYIPTLQMELVMGRNFDPAIASDSNAVVVNEALVNDMKWADPLNEYLNFKEDPASLGAKVIGVVKDYHYRSLESPINPLFLTMDYNYSGSLNTMMIRVKPDDIPSTMATISTAWKELYPDKPYDYTFLDEDVAKQYKSYERWMNIMGLATALAIIISCMGLFGLAGINAVNRTKEIGIRKVMGAPLSSVFVLLNKQFIVFALISFIIAIPLSWYVMKEWLSSFTFAITIGWEVFVFSILAGVMIALLTVSYHAFRAALTNPADTLKHE